MATNHNDNNVIFEDEVTLTVTKKSFVTRDGEVINYNELMISMLGEEFKVKLNETDKKLFKYLLGDR